MVGKIIRRGLGLSFLLALGANAFAVDIAEIERLLGSTGVPGWIHGSVSDRSLYVFTYRNPKDFFDYIIMSVIAEDPAIVKQLSTLDRHDQVLLKGKFMQNPSPQKHILVSTLEVIKKFEPTYPVTPYQYEARIPDELLNVPRATFLVHAIGGEGKILVVEYKDQIIPIYVKKPELTQGLWRNDLVDLAIRMQREPNQPTHLRVVDTDPEPVKIIESIKALHGKAASVEGALILFPKSPEIKLNVFAVEQKLPSGAIRQFTLTNLNDMEVFMQVTEKLQKAWDKYPGAYVNGRNKRLSTRLRVKATGVFNEIDPNQANAQIFLPTVDAVEVLE